MTTKAKWRELAISAYNMLTLARDFDNPPDYYGWSLTAIVDILEELRDAVRQEGMDLQANDLRRRTMAPYCNICGRFECVIGRDCCSRSLEADAYWAIKKTPNDGV